jgi:dTDP-4-dehydrorhamnose 3,5-epimerase
MAKSLSESPYIIPGGSSKDARGMVLYVNGFNLQGIKRFYIIENKRKKMIRAWHAHRDEAKYVYVISGKALVGAVKIDNWKNPSKKSKVHKFVLSWDKPEILYIPKGFANGLQSLTSDAKVIFFSTKTLDESLNDDVRFDSSFWNIWD